MIDFFLKKYSLTSKNDNSSRDKELYSNLPKAFVGLISKIGGAVFENGILRIHTFESSLHWAVKLERYFTDKKEYIYPFAFDWLGRHFCINSQNGTVYMFDSAMFELFALPGSVSSFFENDLVDDSDALLGISLFNTVCAKLKIEKLEFEQCIGYKVPLYLGGKDEIQNFEIQNLEVYWEIMYQIYVQVKDLPEGTKIGKISFE